MTARSNFTTVKHGPDSTKLSVSGTSEALDEVQEICITYAGAADVLAAGPGGGDLLPVKSQTTHTIPGPLVNPWTTSIDVDPGISEIVIAGSALRVRKDADGVITDCDHDTWLGYFAPQPEGAVKPAPP